VSGRSGDNDTLPPRSEISEIDEYVCDEEQALSPSAAMLLRPRRSIIGPLLAIGTVTLLAAIGFSALDPVEQPWPDPQNEAPQPPKQPDRLSQQLAEPAEPFKSFVMDAAQSYLTAGRLPVAGATPPGVKPGLPAARR